MLCTPSPSSEVGTDTGDGAGGLMYPCADLPNPDRPDGYYWVVKRPLKWVIAEYSDGCWYFPGDDMWYRDHDLMAIREIRILLPGRHQQH
jgi:hypothetical protein